MKLKQFFSKKIHEFQEIHVQDPLLQSTHCFLNCYQIKKHNTEYSKSMTRIILDFKEQFIQFEESDIFQHLNFVNLIEVSEIIYQRKKYLENNTQVTHFETDELDFRLVTFLEADFSKHYPTLKSYQKNVGQKYYQGSHAIDLLTGNFLYLINHYDLR